MKNLRAVLAFLLCIFVSNTGCKKTNADNSNNNPAAPVATPVGTPVGSTVTQTIGAGGGDMISADSMVELHFQAGALSSNTPISIQAITNNVFGGLGNAYRFLPSGLKFTSGVNVVFHYTPEQIDGSIADLMGIAFQDSSGIWWRLGDFTVDSVNRTVSASIAHFTDYVAFNCIKLQPPHANVNVSKTVELAVFGAIIDDKLLIVDPQGGGSIAGMHPIIHSDVMTWEVNGIAYGNSTFGTISDLKTISGIRLATYTAPATVPFPSSVAASVDLKGTFTYHHKTYKDFMVFTNIQIIDGKSFLVEMVDTRAPDFPNQIYRDSASFIASWKSTDFTPTVSNTQNFPPVVTPLSAVEYIYCTYTWVKKPNGELNIQSVYGYLSADSVELAVVNSGYWPLFTYTCPNSNGGQTGGGQATTQFAIKFSIQDSIIIYHGDFLGGPGDGSNSYYRVTRIY